MLAHTHTVWRSPTEETQKCGITPGRHNASGRCDHDGDGEKEKKRKRGKEIGTDLVLNPTNESARSFPGGWRLRGESCSRGRTLLLVDVGTLIPYSSPRSLCGCHGSFRHSFLLGGCNSGRAQVIICLVPRLTHCPSTHLLLVSLRIKIKSEKCSSVTVEIVLR
jgi:hypothetical protein